MTDTTKPTKKVTFRGDGAIEDCKNWTGKHPNITINSQISGIDDGVFWIEITYWD